ncbi:sugar phosphate isomerase/epimerase [Rhizobium sp. CG5]|uniref:sugar phosphate isomerase/epimerase family protein n=1 Tax=Rhizobium sp. CG5 TaxID=2726076 RepID=UPI002033E756|nr:sugar phosphate isomerase/epimerase [Rhizobium sp. CG5]MCM2477218.1 sugar phosphate isomerase/epimerase [Rhizobium sp. CG5]
MTKGTAEPTLSVQLYTLRELGELDLILDAVEGAGYRNVELIGTHLDDAGGLAAKLAARGLSASSSHVSMAALREKPEAILDACHTLGFEHLFMPSVPAPERLSPAAYWQDLGLELGKLADRFATSGIRLGYHNHNWEMVEKEDGRIALDILFDAAGASPLSWEADIAWIVRGGLDPHKVVPQHKGRMAAAHVKDLAADGQNLDEAGWADVGHGVLNWTKLWQLCLDNGAGLMVVEHDKPLDPVKSVTNSFNYITRKKV